MRICYSKLTLVAVQCLLYVGNSNSQSTGTTCETILLPEYEGCPPWENIPTYFPYPYDCRRFIECSNGYAIVHCCPERTVWDQDLLVCNHEAATPCVIVTTEAPFSSTSTTTTPTTTTPTTTTPTTTTPTTTTPTTTTPTTTTPTTTTPTTTIPTTTTPTTTTPTTTTPTTTTPTTTTPTTTTPTTTTPTTTTPTTTTPTTTTPTTTTTRPTTTTTRPTTTTTRPTTTTTRPTTTTTRPTTTTTRPTTTTTRPTTTTTRPTTTTTRPTTTTTRPTTTTTRPTTTTPPPIDGSSHLIINVQANRALDVYSASLTNGNAIQTYTISGDCSNLAEVWRLEFFSSTSTYVIRSALGGANAWRHTMHTNGSIPYIWYPVGQDGYWHVVRVSGTNYWNIYNRQYNSTGRSSLRNTGVASGNGGIKLEIAPLQPSDIAQRWELRKC